MACEACELYLLISVRERRHEHREISPTSGLRAGSEGPLSQQKMPTFPLWAHSSQSLATNKAADGRYKAPRVSASVVPRLSSFIPPHFCVLLPRGQPGLGRGRARDQPCPLVSREKVEKGKRKGQSTPLQGPLGRRLGKATPSTLSKGPPCSLPWPQKRNSRQSALSHSLSAPQGRGDFLPGPLAGSGSSHGLCILLSHPRLSPRAADQPASDGPGLVPRFLSRKHGFRGQREPSS